MREINSPGILCPPFLFPWATKDAAEQVQHHPGSGSCPGLSACRVFVLYVSATFAGVDDEIIILIWQALMDS